MKKYIYFIFLLGLFACQEDDLVRYAQEKDAMQFFIDEENSISSKRIFNFATATYLEEENGVEKEYYYGDSLSSMTYNGTNSIIMELQGFPTPDERPYRLKTVLLEGQDSTKVAEVVFDSYYSLAPNSLRDTIQFTVLRPKKRGTYRVGIAIDTDNSDGFFEKGVVEKSVLELEIKDVYEEPEGWQARKEWLGEFDEEKYAFMVTYSQQLFSRANTHMWNETDAYNLELRQALEKFNASVEPEEQKTFSFPETTKPTWWDSQLNLLGEFSEEKHDFMKDVVGGKLANEHLEYWNVVFRQELEKEGITDIEIPRNERQVSWWRTSALGDWSVEKQEFVILHIFPMSNFNITDETWDYANVMLRSVIAEEEQAPTFNIPIEGEPYWWTMRAEVLGEFSVVKRDLLVEYIYKENINDYPPMYSIYQLVSPTVSLDYYMKDFREMASEWNDAHPEEEPITFPVIAPSWWNNQIANLGEWSEEKENFIKSVCSSFEATYQEWLVWKDWNPILRYELAYYNNSHQQNPYDFVFPTVNSKPTYWNKDELPYLGEYSESKKVFVWTTLMPQNWGSVDGWYLGAPSEYGDPNVWPARAQSLKEAYDTTYEEFMNKYAAANPEPFTFPEFNQQN